MLARQGETVGDPLVTFEQIAENQDTRLVNQRIAVGGVDLEPVDHALPASSGVIFGDRDGEFLQRRFLVDHAVELAPGVAAEPSAARQIADIRRDLARAKARLLPAAVCMLM